LDLKKYISTKTASHTKNDLKITPMSSRRVHRARRVKNVLFSGGSRTKDYCLLSFFEVSAHSAREKNNDL
jgi:hypothetical protein